MLFPISKQEKRPIRSHVLMYRAVEVNFPFEFLCLYKGCYYFFNIFWGYKSEAGPSELKSKYKYFTASVMTSI